MSEAKTNPFLGLMLKPPRRLPLVANAVVVVEGKRLDGARLKRGQKLAGEVALDGHERDDLDEREAMLRRERANAYYRARHQAKKDDPVYQAKRREWEERNREHAYAYRRAWVLANREKARARSRESAARIRKAGTDEQKARLLESRKRYYATHREELLARKRAETAQSQARAKAKREAMTPDELERNKELKRQKNREYYLRNLERERARSREKAARAKAAKGVML